jgi:hypothetical protein
MPAEAVTAAGAALMRDLFAAPVSGTNMRMFLKGGPHGFSPTTSEAPIRVRYTFLTVLKRPFDGQLCCF